MKQKVSIIIRTRNEEKWISHCLKNIFSQTYKNIEIIIVDNYSTDKTLQKIKWFPHKLIKIKKFLPGKALNLGIEKASGSIIVCLSAHCIPVNNDWLKNLIKPLKKSSVGGVYGRQQPLSYSSTSDKRDLITIFGLDKKIQIKDPFFHNANSAFKKSTWKKISFDEKTTNIEDRIWGKRIISNGLRIIYEPVASVFHWHGVHQDQDPTRASNVVKIIENLEKNLYQTKVHEPEKLDIVAIISIKGKNLVYKNKKIIEASIKSLKETKLVKKIFLNTDNLNTSKLAKKYKIDKIIRPKLLSKSSSDLISVSRYALNKIEKKGIIPDFIILLTEEYPFRENNFFTSLIKKIVNDGLDLVMTATDEKGGIWTQDKKDNVDLIVDGLIPKKLRTKTTLRTSFGAGCIITPQNLRSGNIYKGKVGFLKVENPISFISINEKNINKIMQKIFNINI
jgi:glycosyltransferase involved in cell wall biosynthesis